MNLKRTTLRHIITQVSNRYIYMNPRSRKRKVISNIPKSFHNIIDGFFSRNYQARREWVDIFKLLKAKNVNQEDCI